jgi:sugar lactone lactonase YvrE
MSTNTIQIFHDQPMLVGESPLWSAAQNSLYWTDIPRRTVHCKDVDSLAHRSWLLPSEPGCIALHANGGLVVAMRQGIAHFDTETGAVTALTQAPYDTQKMRFNDGRCDAKGRLWIGTMYEPRDQALGSLYCLDRGRLSERNGRVTVSNGLAFSPDGQTMYHADTSAHRIDRYRYTTDDGTLFEKSTFKSFSSERDSPSYGGRPDGAAVDTEGGYWVAMFEGARLLRFAPDGAVLQEVVLPVRCPTMMAFGGSDLRTLFITSASQNRSPAEMKAYPLSGCVLSLRVAVPGCTEPEYQP